MVVSILLVSNKTLYSQTNSMSNFFSVIKLEHNSLSRLNIHVVRVLRIETQPVVKSTVFDQIRDVPCNNGARKYASRVTKAKISVKGSPFK